MNIEIIVRTISLILAPTVMVTSCALFLNGLITRYEHISSRMRAMHRERLDLLRATDASQSTTMIAHLNMQRILELEQQLPYMLRRHKLVRNAVLAVSVAISIFVSSMFIIAAAALVDSSLNAVLALFAFQFGTGALMLGVGITTVEFVRSQREVTYEIQHGLSLRKEILTREERDTPVSGKGD